MNPPQDSASMSPTSSAEEPDSRSRRPAASGRIQPQTSLISRAKQRLMRGLYWMLQHLPSWLFSLAVNLMIGCARILYWCPGNQVRKGVHDVCALAARAGHRHDPWSVYRRLTGQIGMALEGAFGIYRSGVEANLHRVTIEPQILAIFRRCLEEYNGVLVTVPHNLGGLFSAFRLNHELPTLIISRQDTRDAAKSAMHRDMFDRLGLEVLMAKGATPRQVLSTCVDGARQGKVVIFSVDNIHTGRVGAVRETIFGEKVRIATWAARIARRAGVPILPGYIGQRGDTFHLHFGEPLIIEQPADGVRHFLTYFQERILADPGSWAYLLDRKWRRVLAAAASRAAGGGRRAPHRHEIAAATVKYLYAAPPHKADLKIVDLGDGPMVIKDYADKPWWCRLYGPFFIGHESRAYSYISPIAGLPVFFGRVDRHALAIEMIDGEWLIAIPERFEKRSQHFGQLRRLMDRLAAAGFLHLDIRTRRNIMMRRDGEIVALDLEVALWRRPGTPGFVLFNAITKVFYKAALLKWKKLLTPGRAPREAKIFPWRRGVQDLVKAVRWRGRR